MAAGTNRKPEQFNPISGKNHPWYYQRFVKTEDCLCGTFILVFKYN